MKHGELLKYSFGVKLYRKSEIVPNDLKDYTRYTFTIHYEGNSVIRYTRASAELAYERAVEIAKEYTIKHLEKYNNTINKLIKLKLKHEELLVGNINDYIELYELGILCGANEDLLNEINIKLERDDSNK